MAAPGPMAPVVTLIAPRTQGAGIGGRRSVVRDADSGRTVGARAPNGAVERVAVVPTLQAAAARRAAAADAAAEDVPAFTEADLREPVRETRTGNLVVLAVDASGSMGMDDRMEAVKGALLGLLVDAYQRRDRVALVTFRGDGAEIVLRPTGSVEVARSRLETLATGGETPLAEGIRLAADLARRSATAELRPLLVLVTDGRATATAAATATVGDANPTAAALSEAAAVAKDGLPAVVVDVESPDSPRLGLAVNLALAMGARHIPLPALTAGRLEAALRSL